MGSYQCWPSKNLSSQVKGGCPNLISEWRTKVPNISSTCITEIVDGQETTSHLFPLMFTPQYWNIWIKLNIPSCRLTRMWRTRYLYIDNFDIIIIVREIIGFPHLCKRLPHGNHAPASTVSFPSFESNSLAISLWHPHDIPKDEDSASIERDGLYKPTLSFGFFDRRVHGKSGQKQVEHQRAGEIWWTSSFSSNQTIRPKVSNLIRHVSWENQILGWRSLRSPSESRLLQAKPKALGGHGMDLFESTWARPKPVFIPKNLARKWWTNSGYSRMRTRFSDKPPKLPTALFKLLCNGK